MTQRRRPSPAVYRRRRLVAALLAVFFLALAIWGARVAYEAFATGDEQTESSAQTEPEDDNDAAPAPADEPTDEPDEGDAETDDDGAEASEETVEEGHCAPADIEVRARTSHEAYDASTAPL